MSDIRKFIVFSSRLSNTIWHTDSCELAYLKNWQMKKRAAILFFSCLSFASANPLSLTPVDRFIADRDFCAYMVSLPEHDAEEFLKRFQAAMSSATSFIRHEDQYLTEAQAIFSVKKKCDEALASLLHYK
jgi:hypothetical protein